MKKIIFALIALALLPTAAFAQDTTEEPAPPQPDGVAVTIYNEGTALVQDRRTLSFSAGENIIDFADVAAQIDPTSVSFVSLTDPSGTLVLEQNYVYDVVGSDALYNRYLDQEIRLTLTDGTEVVGTLLSARGGSIIVQRGRDGSVVLLDSTSVRDVQFPSLPDGLITRPTLRWTVNSANSGDQQVEITYLTGGINWTADYNILLARSNAALNLDGWVTLNNNSGTAYNDAQVKLVAGDVNRLPQEREFAEEAPVMAAPMADAAGAGAVQREFFEYQLYELNRFVTIGNNETKQVQFVSGANVPANTFYVFDATPRYQGYPIPDQGYGQTGITDVQNYLEFETSEADGLGADLPAGRVRVYQEDVDGAALLIGENRIDHTPEGEPVSLYIGNAFDLVGERTQTNFRYISDRVLQESFEIELRNRKDDQAVEIRVPETLYRWTNWEILEASDVYEQLNANQIEFRVTVQPGETRVIRYTVQYSFPR